MLYIYYNVWKTFFILFVNKDWILRIQGTIKILYWNNNKEIKLKCLQYVQNIFSVRFMYCNIFILSTRVAKIILHVRELWIYKTHFFKLKCNWRTEIHDFTFNVTSTARIELRAPSRKAFVSCQLEMKLIQQNSLKIHKVVAIYYNAPFFTIASLLNNTTQMLINWMP